MNEITIPCSNCKQPIAESKHMLHETYCLRNNIKCQKCGQFYDKNDPESHEEEYHKKEKCQYCSLESEDLKKHKCLKKPKQCMHCDLYFPTDQIFSHETQCGSRTQKCDICNNYVMIREYESHVITCKPKPKAEPPQVQNKPSYSDIFDKPNYNKQQIDDRFDQQKFNSKKETSQQDAQSQAFKKQQLQQQQQQQQQQTKPVGSGYKYGQAAGEAKNSYQIKDEDKNRQKDNIRPPSSNTQTGSRTQKQPTTQAIQPKQQPGSLTNQRQQNSTQKEDKTQFDNQYEKQQYLNKQSQQIQPQPQQQQRQPVQNQKSLESYKNPQNNKPQSYISNNRPDLRRPDTAIAREIQKQMEVEEQFGMSSEEYLEQKMLNEMSQKEKQEKAPPIKKAPPPPPQTVVPEKFPQYYDSKEFDFEGISEDEKLIQQQIMESLKFNQKKS
ncbi:unnamed protein product (macronuclear) [Paramecium tetraurelia]|uniref:TRAFD1/XAF1 zinc finger domain-containing protein n=1 Tax=Paramecium tetraurelia TaxID=5888 RepID=A0D170_PARTE|nr:uncharacterized protein GSPATT00012311001 [Paramecium tetraurelia]CAK76787.1 unnamed protein product [Paramecium tetraurelia]|eukprot:XP_001444184.1 hypothetical protein (macronuclear) [Paramecium tetraurelia strain d4-2]